MNETFALQHTCSRPGVNLVASIVCGLNAGVDISSVKSVVEQAKSGSLNIWVLLLLRGRQQ